MMFSIIIPSYNQQNYLCDAIDSALAQPVSEVIVIDDGSTDSSLAIARGYEKHGVKVISQVNKGLSSARNTGIMNAKGEWILPLDADDILLDNCVEKLIETIAGFDTDVVSPSFKTFGVGSQDVVLMPNPTLEDFRTGNRVGYCSAIKKSVLQAVGGYSPRMTEGYEDLALTCNLLIRGFKLMTIPDILWLYRTKEDSMYTRIKPEIHKKLLEQINKDFPEANLNF
jgi:glycosyltransferase involved in cell wall biosynthesis